MVDCDYEDDVLPILKKFEGVRYDEFEYHHYLLECYHDDFFGVYTDIKLAVEDAHMHGEGTYTLLEMIPNLLVEDPPSVVFFVSKK